jgi:hypothetical protein
LDHRRLVLAGGGVAVQDLADQLGAHHGAALVGARNSAVHELPFECQQLRRREQVDPEPAIMGDADGPLGQEPVGGRLDLGERLLSGMRDGEPLGERVHHLGAREGARLLGQPLWAGQLLQDPPELPLGDRAAALT